VEDTAEELANNAQEALIGDLPQYRRTADILRRFILENRTKSLIFAG
jgi:hypothetical protein